MDMTLGYILSNLEKAENSIRSALSNQRKINRVFAKFAIASAIYVLVMNKHHKEQDKQIKKLSKELEELKTTKGR